MECLNKIELKGFVGNITHNHNTGVHLSRFSLCTQEATKSANDIPLVQTTWFSCLAVENDNMKDLPKVKRGTKVHIIGKVKMSTLLSPSENERYVWEVVCQSLEIIED